MDSRLQIKPTPYRKTCFNLAIDDSEKILAIGRWFAITGSERKQKAEFGIQLLRLPSLKPLRTVFIAGHQLVHPALSPDGKHLAFEAHQVGAYRYFVAIIETATGREIARRKSNMIRALEFLRDGKTLAIAGSGFTTSEPVLLWTFGKAAGPKR